MGGWMMWIMIIAKFLVDGPKKLRESGHVALLVSNPMNARLSGQND